MDIKDIKSNIENDINKLTYKKLLTLLDKNKDPKEINEILKKYITAIDLHLAVIKKQKEILNKKIDKLTN